MIVHSNDIVDNVDISLKKKIIVDFDISNSHLYNLYPTLYLLSPNHESKWIMEDCRDFQTIFL